MTNKNNTIDSAKIVEPIKKSKFIVEFPQELNIESWSIYSITMPTINNGNKYGKMSIMFRKFIEPLTSKAVLGLINKKNYNIEVKIVNDIHDVVETWVVTVHKLKHIHFDSYSYSSLDSDNDNVTLINAEFKVKKIKLI